MATTRSFVCENCEIQTLEWCPDANGGEGGYICPSWRSYEDGVGCFRVFSLQELKERCEDDVDDGDETAVEEKESDDDSDDDDDNENDNGERYCESDFPEDDRKAENVAALLSGHLVVKRQPLLPKVLSVSDVVESVRKPFKSPCPGVNTEKRLELQRRLYARKRFVPWGSSRGVLSPLTNILLEPLPLQPATEDDKVDELPPGIEPLVLWETDDEMDGKCTSIVVDPRLVRFLRPHQREGVQFMFECVAGLRDFSKSDNQLAGCILADDMGLGKTLQSITLLWTLLKQGFDGSPIAQKVLIVTPTSLVSNWESEIEKWLVGQVRVLALCESTRADVISGIAGFLAPRSLYQVLILSYETFRMHAKKFQQPGSCDLLICDEAHRLKNDQTCINKALASLHCRRRVLLSGTPMQNDLEEFFSMVNFTNPGILGSASAFRRYFEMPILNGREPNATEEEKTKGSERSSELSEKVNQFILRRTNALLSNHLPPKIVEIVCCKLTELQEKLYRHFIHSKNVRQVLQDNTKRARVLSSILALKKLCNHPKLIYDTVRSGGSNAAGFENCLDYFPSEMFSGRKGSWSGVDGSWIELSGKMSVLARLLAKLRQTTNDRIVLVSNYTQTLELFAQLCRERNYPYVKLDGTTSISKRQKLVQKFNDPLQDEFAFLLSSKAGGCGLNLIGGNRLVLFDPDWNPANDKQAAARVWRDGQKKRVFIYRFLAAGTIEEKVFERQLSKEGLQKVVEHQQMDDSHPQGSCWLSSEDLRDLFSLRDNVGSIIHENLNCKRCEVASDDVNLNNHEGTLECPFGDIGAFADVAGCLDRQRSWEKQIGSPLEEELRNWGHHSHPSTVPDVIFQAAAGNEVSFVFTCQIDGKLVPIDSCIPVLKAPENKLLKGRQELRTVPQTTQMPHSIIPCSMPKAVYSETGRALHSTKSRNLPKLRSVKTVNTITNNVLPAKRTKIIEIDDSTDDEFM